MPADASHATIAIETGVSESGKLSAARMRTTVVLPDRVRLSLGAVDVTRELAQAEAHGDVALLTGAACRAP